MMRMPKRISQKSRHWISLTFDAITKYDVEAAGPKVKAPRFAGLRGSMMPCAAASRGL